MEYEQDDLEMNPAEYFSSTEPGSGASFESRFGSSSFGSQASYGNAGSQYMGQPGSFQGYHGYQSPYFLPYPAEPPMQSLPFTHMGQIYHETSVADGNGLMTGCLNDMGLGEALLAVNERDDEPMRHQDQMAMPDVREPVTNLIVGRNGPLVPESLLSQLLKEEEGDDEVGMRVS